MAFFASSPFTEGFLHYKKDYLKKEQVDVLLESSILNSSVFVSTMADNLSIAVTGKSI